MNKFYVYAHYRLDTKELFHIGKGSGKRYKDCRRRNKHAKAIMKKHGWTHKILADNLSEEIAFILEKALIAEYKPVTNYHPGGLGGDTWKGMSRKTRQERINKLKEKNSGANHPQFGIKRSEETKLRIKQAMFLGGHMQPVLCLNTGEIFTAVSYACREYDIDPRNMTRHLNGKGHTVKGLKFVKYDWKDKNDLD